MPVYLDEQGNPIGSTPPPAPFAAAGKVYLDDDGNPIGGPPPAAMHPHARTAQAALGFVKEAGGRLLDLGDFLRQNSLFGAVTGRDAMPGGTRAAFPSLAASNPQQQFGAQLEHVAEFAPVGPGAARATAGMVTKAPRVARAVASALEGIGTAGVSAGQGGSSGDVAEAGVFGAVTGPAGALISKGATAVKTWGRDYLAPRIVNSLVKPVSSAFAFGKNPGRGVSHAGIKANSLDDLAEQLGPKVEEAGQAIDKHLSMPMYAKRKVDVLPALQPLRDAIAKAVKDGEETLLGRLRDLEKKILHEFRENPKTGALEIAAAKPTTVSPLGAAQLKREIGEKTKWREGDPYADEINGIRVAIYGKLNDLIEAVAPGTRTLNATYADRLTALKATERRKAVEQRQNLVGLPATLTGTATAITSALSGQTSPEAILHGLILGGFHKAASSTAAKTRLAAALSKLNAEQRALLDRALPTLRSLYLGLGASDDAATTNPE